MLSGYVSAVFVLFQFISVQLAVGFYEKPATQGTVQFKAALVKTVAKPTPKAKIALGLPTRITIPRMRVNSAVLPVGITPAGAMGIPKRPQDTTWYMLGPKPGEVGSAVIAGHLNWLYGATGAFQYLHTLKPGDKITVQNDLGKSVTFVVRKTRWFGKNDDAADVFYSYDGKSHLNLVTCAGVWDKVSKAYSKRLVVFADKVE